MICPYKNMTQLHSLPCTRENRGGWLYCSFCGQKTRPEIPFSLMDGLIGFWAIFLILIFLAASLESSPRRRETINSPQSLNSVIRNPVVTTPLCGPRCHVPVHKDLKRF